MTSLQAAITAYKALDKACAVALGYTVYHYDKDYEANCYYQLMDREFDPAVMFPYRSGERKTEAEAWGDCPNFSTNYEAARLLEDEIERRGLEYSYSNALVDIVQYNGTGPIVWAALRATPEQRTRAFLKAVA